MIFDYSPFVKNEFTKSNDDSLNFNVSVYHLHASTNHFKSTTHILCSRSTAPEFGVLLAVISVGGIFPLTSCRASIALFSFSSFH
jgi:hypothetical protein